MALDLSPTSVASMIMLFADTSSRQRVLPSEFLEEIRYANPHDLAAVIKWAFARMGRVLAVPVPVQGPKRGEMREEMVYVQQRGFLELESYNTWREQERRHQYPAAAFTDFLSPLAPENAKLLSSLFSLLSSTASYSLKNGMMPARLAKHFGPLIFGLPEDETFARTYEAYVRASNATEHLLLSYIRFQATTETLPPRLAQHISGYPAMLATEMTVPSASSKLVPVTQIERNVRLYSADLVQSACEIEIANSCPEWKDCCDTNEVLGKDPQLSDKFRKLVNLRGGAIQGRRPSSSKARDASIDEDDAVAAHSSLVSKQWDDFMFGGFSAPDSSKLAFDLNESVRRNRTAKRETMQWNEFSKAGFQNGESGTLADVLSFDDVLRQDVRNWPSERDQLNAKLRSQQDKLPAFNYDNTPRLVASPTLAGTPQGKLASNPISRMDETFADVWADYLVGSGWSNRDELTHRNANFAVVQYKSRPNASTVGSQSAESNLAAPTSFQVSARKDESLPKDERVDAAWFVVQEIVPAQYRADLEASGRGVSKGRAMLRKLTVFRSRKDKEKVNGNGNGHANERSMDSADDVFRPGPGGSTKRILLADQLERVGSKNASQATLRSNRTSVDRSRPSSALAGAIRTDADQGEATPVQEPVSNAHAPSRSEGQHTGSKFMSTLRAKSIRVVKSARSRASSPALKSQAVASNDFGAQSSPRTGNPSPLQPNDAYADNSFTSADYETRTIAIDASPPMGGNDVSIDSSSAAPKQKHGQSRARESNGRTEAWVDISVKHNGNRVVDRDVPHTSMRKTSLGLNTRADDTAQLSLMDPETGASTPRLGDDADAFDEGPRSSTPPLPANGVLVGLGLDDSQADRSSIASDIPMRDASLRDATPLPAQPDLPLVPAPAIDPVVAARAALKSRREAPPRAPAQIDAKKLVESLRAGLSPIEAVRASKEGTAPTSPPLSSFGDVSLKSPTTSAPAPAAASAAGRSKTYRDPFAKDPVAGRVADVASKFGGRAGVPSKKGDVEKPLPASPAVERDPDEIYPEDAVSNHATPVHSVDTPAARLDLAAAGEMETLSPQAGVYQWRKHGLEAKGEEQGAAEVPTRFAEPYQPGMPLDNVLEESESAVSGNTNV
uniref:Meiotically up-regulated protein Msb1/Mug8 domain-containing protein n=2 Tax=Kalmanozyma brasiliensis (strain GHG001) TaxID=1365824 RepID=V5GID4_KALBG